MILKWLIQIIQTRRILEIQNFEVFRNWGIISYDSYVISKVKVYKLYHSKNPAGKEYDPWTETFGLNVNDHFKEIIRSFD